MSRQTTSDPERWVDEHGDPLYRYALLRVRERDNSLANILDLPYGERDVPVTAVTETHSTFIEGAVSFAGKVVDQVDGRGSLAHSLELARIPLRVGEYVVANVRAAVESYENVK